MSTEAMKDAINQELGANTDVEDNEDQNQGVEETSTEHTETEHEHEEEQSPDEIKASGKGWVPKEDYKGNQEDWRPAKHFNEMGSVIDRIKQQTEQIRGMESRFEDRLTNVNIMHKGQLESQQKDLQRQFNDAVDERDTEKASEISAQQREVSNMLDETDRQPAQSTVDSDDKRMLAEWNRDNPWISTNTDRARMAHHAFKSATDLGQGVQAAIEAANAASVERPAANQNRAKASDVSNGGGGGGRKNSGRQYTINDVPRELMGMRSMFKDEKSFVKAAEDIERKKA